MHKIEVRNLKITDYMELKKSMIEAYKNWENAYWREHHIQALLEKFPEGQICVLVDDKIVGTALSLIINYEDFGDGHNDREVTGNFTFETHNPEGDVLYGIEVFIHPDFRGLRLGRRMYEA